MCEGRILQSGVGRPYVLDDECCKIRFIGLDDGSHLFWYTVPFTVQQAIQTSFSSVTTVLPPLLEATVADFNIKKYLNEFSEETFYIDWVWTMIMLIWIELIWKRSLLSGTTGHSSPCRVRFILHLNDIWWMKCYQLVRLLRHKDQTASWCSSINCSLCTIALGMYSQYLLLDSLSKKKKPYYASWERTRIKTTIS